MTYLVKILSECQATYCSHFSTRETKARIGISDQDSVSLKVVTIQVILSLNFRIRTFCFSSLLWMRNELML